MFGSPFPGLVFLSEVGEAGCGVGIMRNEFIIETDHAKKRAEVRKTARRGKVTYALDFICGHTDTLTANDVKAEEVAFFGKPLALMRLEAETIVSEGFEDEADVFLVLLERTLSVDDDVIEVSVAEDTEVGVENGIDKPLKDGGGGGESHGHDGILIRSEEGFESGGFLRAGGHAEIGETRANVHCGDPVGASEIIHESA